MYVIRHNILTLPFIFSDLQPKEMRPCCNSVASDVRFSPFFLNMLTCCIEATPLLGLKLGPFSDFKLRISDAESMSFRFLTR